MGKRLTFKAPLGDPFNLYWMSADGLGVPERLTAGENITWPGSWSPDGRTLAFISNGPEPTNFGIWLLKLEGERKPQPFLQTQTTIVGGVFSPDGHWLAYCGSDTGRLEVYVQPVSGPGARWQISADGGREPVWNRNGRELFYRSVGNIDNKMMAVDVVTQPPTFSAGKPSALFEGRYIASLGSPADYEWFPARRFRSPSNRVLL